MHRRRLLDKHEALVLLRPRPSRYPCWCCRMRGRSKGEFPAKAACCDHCRFRGSFSTIRHQVAAADTNRRHRRRRMHRSYHQQRRRRCRLSSCRSSFSCCLACYFGCFCYCCCFSPCSFLLGWEFERLQRLVGCHKYSEVENAPKLHSHDSRRIRRFPPRPPVDPTTRSHHSQHRRLAGEVSVQLSSSLGCSDSTNCTERT